MEMAKPNHSLTAEGGCRIHHRKNGESKREGNVEQRGCVADET